MKKALARKGFALCILMVFVMVMGPADVFAAGPSLAVQGQEHPGLKGQPAGNQAIGKVLWQPLKAFVYAANILDALFRGNFKSAAKQAVTAPFNYAVSTAVDGATLATGDMKVYGSPGGQEMLKLGDAAQAQTRIASAYNP